MLSIKWPPWTCSPSRTLDEVSRIYFCTYDMISSKMSLIKVQIKRFDLSVILEIISYSHDTWQDCDLLSLVGQQGWGIWCVFGNSDILQVTFYRNFSDFHVIQFAWFRMEDTDYSVAGSPLKTLIRGEEHFFHIMIWFQLCAGDCPLPSGFANLLLFGSPMRTLKWWGKMLFNLIVSR